MPTQPDARADFERVDCERADFELAVGAEFGAAVSPPVAFEDASPAECMEAVRNALGEDLTPTRLANLGDQELQALAQAFAQWFETEEPSQAELKSALDRIAFRWPPGSLGEARGDVSA